MAADVFFNEARHGGGQQAPRRLDTRHDVRLRRTDLVREVLDWYDKYLGRVQ